MTRLHTFFLGLSCAVIITELTFALIYREAIFEWVSHHLWIVILPFTKLIVKRLIALKLVVFLKASGFLIANLLKLLLLKLFKTLGIRYGIFFSQNRWYWIRRAKVMFLRRGRQFFRAASRFWSVYSKYSQWLIFIAFFPVVVVLFLLGLSFNVTRKTMVQKTQETAVFQMATSASSTSRGIKAFIERLDRKTLDAIRNLTPRGKGNRK